MSGLNNAECLVCRLGLVTFPEAMQFERRLLALRHEEKIGDVLLIFEHPPTVTLGRSGKPDNILLPLPELERRGIAFYDSDRGGDATFNCPGQPVIHPVMDIRKRPGILRSYITDLEEMSLRALGSYGIAAERWSRHPGIWVKGKQIGAVGLRISRGVTMHGMSLNVNPDLAAFNVINLCGLAGTLPTSIENELGRSVSTEEFNKRVQDSFAGVFQTRLIPISKQELARACFEEQPAQA